MPVRTDGATVAFFFNEDGSLVGNAYWSCYDANNVFISTGTWPILKKMMLELEYFFTKNDYQHSEKEAAWYEWLRGLGFSRVKKQAREVLFSQLFARGKLIAKDWKEQGLWSKKPKFLGGRLDMPYTQVVVNPWAREAAEHHGWTGNFAATMQALESDARWARYNKIKAEERERHAKDTAETEQIRQRQIEFNTNTHAGLGYESSVVASPFTVTTPSAVNVVTDSRWWCRTVRVEWTKPRTAMFQGKLSRHEDAKVKQMFREFEEMTLRDWDSARIVRT